MQDPNRALAVIARISELGVGFSLDDFGTGYVFWTCKDILTLERRHGARTLPGLREPILQRFLCLAAAVTLNHQLARPSRALVNYCA